MGGLFYGIYYSLFSALTINHIIVIIKLGYNILTDLILQVIFVIYVKILIAAFVLMIITVFIAFLCYKKVFTVDKEKIKSPYKFPSSEQYERVKDIITSMIDTARKIKCEDVFIKSHDNFLLHGRYYETTKNAPVQIMFHGYRSHPLKDFSGGLKLAVDMGYNVLLVDQRAHGESEGRCLSFGILERYDCLAWSKYIVDRCGENTKIILVGISMGAASVLMASALDLPYNVKGIIADCGYSSPSEIIRKVMRDLKYPEFPLYRFVKLGAKLFGKFDLECASAKEALKNNKIPVLFIHGDDDRFVPCEMSVDNFNACTGQKELCIIPKAGHALSFIAGQEAYIDAVVKFLKKVI